MANLNEPEFKVGGMTKFCEVTEGGCGPSGRCEFIGIIPLKMLQVCCKNEEEIFCSAEGWLLCNETCPSPFYEKLDGKL